MKIKKRQRKKIKEDVVEEEVVLTNKLTKMDAAQIKIKWKISKNHVVQIKKILIKIKINQINQNF
jgi:hypothetical protein